MFRALGDRTRRDILRQSLLAEQTVSALADRYAMSFAAVQKHVAVLERATLVTKTRHGREQRVRANASTIERAIALLDAYAQLWHDSVQRINDILTASPDTQTLKEGHDCHQHVEGP